MSIDVFMKPHNKLSVASERLSELQFSVKSRTFPNTSLVFSPQIKPYIQQRYSSRLPPEAPNIKRLTPPLNTPIRDLARRKSYIRRTTTPSLQNSTPIPHKRLTSSAWTESDRVYREALLGMLAQKMIESKREQATFISYYFRGHQSGGNHG